MEKMVEEHRSSRIAQKKIFARFLHTAEEICKLKMGAGSKTL